MFSDKPAILDLFSSIDKDDEFEVMFNNYKPDNPLSLVDFMNVMKYLKHRSTEDKLNLYETIALDVFYNEFRISISGATVINNFLGLVHQRKNNNIISVLATQYIDKDGFILIKKEKHKENKVDIDSLDIRFRKSKEIKITDKNSIELLSTLPPSESDKITYRYKQRLTLELEKDLLIDLTIIKTSNNINSLANSPKIYEIEIDYSPIKFNKKDSSKTLDKILEEVLKIKKVMITNDIIISKDLETKILEKYKLLTYGNNNDINNILYSNQPISAEVQHIVDAIPNKYSVTDKADGEKYQLFIYEDESYLISNNLHIKQLNRKIKNMNNTIVEGELISLHNRKYIFMMFDCLVYKGEDVRNTVILRTRLEPLKNITINYGITPYEIKDFSNNFNMIDIKKHYNEVIREFYNNLNKEIAKVAINDVMFYPKLFLYPMGGSPSECFLFSDLLWINCTKNATTKCPYQLDGIIFTPTEQKYTKDKKEQRFPTYKYKPPHMNSLDCYIQFERNKETNGYMDVFDNSIKDILPFKTYRVINLFVGDSINGKEQPVPFMKESNNHTIYLPIVDNMVRDIEGNLVQDKTVVELVYSNNINLPHPYRWNILKTRWDKTESVLRDNKRYGNFKDVAEKVWRSIVQAVTSDEINNLSNPKTYDMQMKLLRSRLDSSVIVSQRKQDIYYQIQTNLVKKMREFHNWIKTVIINTYCSASASIVGGQPKRHSLLDIGCGRGGDLLKMYHARISDYVGIDIDFEGIYSATDGAISRYNYLKGKFPDFGKVTYIQADGGVPYNSEAQSKVIPNLSNENKDTIDKIFTKTRKFDNISSQMAIHYLFGNTTSINNLIDNIKNFLKKDGYILLTLFDANLIHKNFDENNKITSIYTDKEGKRNILYEIVKKYSGELSNIVGMPVDAHMSWISEEGKYIEEYLVTIELLEKTMKSAGCRLIDTDLFANLFHLNKPYFEQVIKYEENPKNKQFFEKIAEFYEDLKGVDKESRNFSFLYRYYIFQKLE